jgi:hypothetical protein
MAPDARKERAETVLGSQYVLGCAQEVCNVTRSNTAQPVGLGIEIRSKRLG